MPRRSLLILCLLVCAAFAQARTLGQTFPELRLSSGELLRNVKTMSYSADKRGVVIAVDRTLRVVPLDHFPGDLQQRILADYDDDRVRIVPNVVTTTVRPSQVTARVNEHSRATYETRPTETGIDALTRQAAEEAPDELRFQLQKNNARVSSLDCKIRSSEQVQGWQQIRVTGTASYSMWNHHDRDYNWRTGKFEVLFDIVNGEKLRASTVTFNGIAYRVED